MMESLNSFEFHWKGTTPARCTRADQYLNETLLHTSPHARGQSGQALHQDVHGQAVAGTCTRPAPPRRQISCQYLILQLCSLGLCYCSDLPCKRIRFDTSRWSAVILLCGIMLRVHI